MSARVEEAAYRVSRGARGRGADSAPRRQAPGRRLAPRRRQAREASGVRPLPAGERVHQHDNAVMPAEICAPAYVRERACRSSYLRRHGRPARALGSTTLNRTTTQTTRSTLLAYFLRTHHGLMRGGYPLRNGATRLAARAAVGPNLVPWGASEATDQATATSWLVADGAIANAPIRATGLQHSGWLIDACSRSSCRHPRHVTPFASDVHCRHERHLSCFARGCSG